MKSLFLLCPFLLIPTLTFPQKILIDARSCKVSAKDQQLIERVLNYEAKLYNNFFNTGLNDTLRIKVTVFANRLDYENFQGMKLSNAHRTSGFFSPLGDQCYVYKHADYKKAIIHEASHCFLFHNMPSTSRFLTEGLAEFFETLEVGAGGEIVYSAQADRVRLVKELVSQPSFSLAAYAFAPDLNWGKRDQVSVLYSVAYSVVYYLLKKNPSTLKKLLLLLQEGHSFEEAIEYSYGGYKNFELEYINFYKSNLIKPI